MNYNPTVEPVATVCGNEVRIYGPVQENGVRNLWKKELHPHHGAAVLRATEYDDSVKRSAERRGNTLS